MALDLYVCSPGVSSDASMILETLCASLEAIAEQFQDESVPLPSSLWLWVSWQSTGIDSEVHRKLGEANSFLVS